MLISSLALALAAAQAGGTPAATGDAFSKCLKREIIAALKERIEPDAFKATIDGKCGAEEAAYRTALVAADTRSGIPASAAREGAEEEIAYWREKYKGDYQGYFDNREMPDDS